MSNSKMRHKTSSKNSVWKTVNRVHHSQAEIKYVSENELPPKKNSSSSGDGTNSKVPWRPAARAIKYEPSRYEFGMDLLSPRPATAQQRSAKPKPTAFQPEKIWKPTNPNCRRPYNEMKLDSENLVDVLKADQEKQKKGKRAEEKLPLYGPWIPADRRYQRGVNWGTINPFPSYDPYIQ